MTIVPILDLIVVIEVHGWIESRVGSQHAFLVTIGSIIFTGLAGASLVRSQGLRVLKQAQQAAAEGSLPGEHLLSGVFVLLGGALLLTPGYLTDLIGFSLMLAPARHIYTRAFSHWFKKRLERGQFVMMSQNFGQGDIRWQSQYHSSPRQGAYSQNRANDRKANHEIIIDVEAEDIVGKEKNHSPSSGRSDTPLGH
jgi:UPF0716 protein FxsA